MTYADDYSNLAEDLEKKRKCVGDLLREDNLMVTDDQTEDKKLKTFKHAKDSKSEP